MRLDQNNALDAPGVVVGIDIGGTGTRFAAMTPERAVIATSTVATPTRLPDGAARFLARGVRDVSGRARLIAVGIGASGPIDVTGVIRNPDTLPAFTGEPILAGLKRELARPVLIDNDAVAAAVAEYEVGSGRGAKCLLHLTLGTGVGGAVLRDGAPVRGGDGEHPEAGHISVAGGPARCYCGRSSCWEQTSSRRALERRAAEVVGPIPAGSSAVPELAARAAGGDPDATRAFDAYGAAVAEGLGSLLAVHRPDVVVIGGSVAGYLPHFHQAMMNALEPLGSWISHPDIRPTALDDFGGAIGGALLAAR